VQGGSVAGEVMPASVVRAARVKGPNSRWTPTSATESATSPVSSLIYLKTCRSQSVGGTGGTAGEGIEVGGKGGRGKGPVISMLRRSRLLTAEPQTEEDSIC
jgi:hypothetical protein